MAKNVHKIPNTYYNKREIRTTWKKSDLESSIFAMIRL